MFEVIPALDVSEGRLVRLAGSRLVPVAAFGGDPVAAGRAFVGAGATRLHVVDLDLARAGRPGNLELLRSLADLGVPVQASGGVTSREQAEALLAAGAERVVLGSAALVDRIATDALVGELGERLVVAIEAEGATIRPRGGRGLELPLWATLGWLVELPVRRFLFVEVGRVGAMEGPDLDGVWALARHTGRPVLASGGIRSLEDLRALAALDGVEGAVVGRALYEGAFTLEEAIAAVGSG